MDTKTTQVTTFKELNLNELEKLSAIGGNDGVIQPRTGGCLISVTVILYTIGRTMTAKGLC